MKDAVRLRRLLAGAHADYLGSLRVAASALSRFAVGEPLLVSDHTPPAVLVHCPLRPSAPPPFLHSLRHRYLQENVDDGAEHHEQERNMETGASAADATAAAEVRMVVRHRSLAEIAAAVEEYFVKIVVAGEAVSRLLEAGEAELDRSFLRLRMPFRANGLLGVLCCVSSQPAAAGNRLDMAAAEGNGGVRSHSSTLERLLAWEKKLCAEVKVREKVKAEHDKKLAELQSQEYSRKEGSDLQKMKASWEKSRSQLAAISTSAATTSSAIAEVRDNELARQLVDLFFGTLDLWRSMHQQHKLQSQIIQQVRGLTDRNSCEPTTDIHHEATRHLEAAMSTWHSSFNRLVKYQRDYVHALHGWLKLTSSSVSSDSSQNDQPSPVATEITAFCERWKQAVDRVRSTDVSKSIKTFLNAIYAMHTNQGDELRIGRRVKRYSRELDRKCRSLRYVEKSYYNSYVNVGIGLWHRGRQWRDDDRQVFDARDEVMERREEIVSFRRKVESEMRRHAKAVDATRSAALSGIQASLPSVFQAMEAFSGSLAHAFESVCRQPAQIL